MLHTISVWLAVAAFFGAGLFNTIGTRATRDDFVRWGYPAQWCRVIGLLEVAVAAMIAFPVSRIAGLILGAIIMVAAAVTVLRHRDLSHLPPVGIYVIMLAIAVGGAKARANLLLRQAETGL